MQRHAVDMRSLLGVGLFSLVGCTVIPSSQGTSEAPIQAGVSDPGHEHDSVGLLWLAHGGFCTGTLVRPNVVLTAAHCVTSPIEGFYTGPGARSDSYNPPKASEGFVRHAIAAQVVNPGYAVNNDCPKPTSDLGLVKLAEPITDIAPMPIADHAAAASTECTTVGYGSHRDGVYFFKERRAARMTLTDTLAAQVSATMIDGVPDSGDSGGPLFCDGAIVGATSCHTDGDWPEHKVELYARVDGDSVSGRAWVDETIASLTGASVSEESSAR